MKTITKDDFEILLDNINDNMKKYDRDITLRMEQSDEAELKYMGYNNMFLTEDKLVYAGALMDEEEI